MTDHDALVERALARLADMALGLRAAPAAWLPRVETRIAALEADEVEYGLIAGERTELDRLKKLASAHSQPIGSNVVAMRGRR